MRRFYQPAREYRGLLKRVAQSMKASDVVGATNVVARTEVADTKKHPAEMVEEVGEIVSKA
jgi:hypothetical protein